MAATFRLSQQKDGSTLRDQFEAIQAMRGEAHPELQYPDMPPELWATHHRFSDLASSDFSYQEFQAYSVMTNQALTSMEIGVIKDLDIVRKLAQAGRTTKQILEAFNYG